MNTPPPRAHTAPLVLSGLLLSWTLPALAQQMPPPPVPDAPPVSAPLVLEPGERTWWDTENRLVRQLRVLRLYADIAEARRDIAGDDGTRTGGRDAVTLPPLAPPLLRPGSSTTPDRAPNPVPDIPPAQPQPARSSGFAVVGIWGVEGEHTADMLNNGMRVSVREGDALTDGWKVQSILRTGVIIAKGRQRETLAVTAMPGG